MKKISIKNKLTNYQFFNLMLLFLMTLNLFGLKMYYLAALIISSIVCIRIKKIDKIGLLLCCFSIFYFINYSLYNEIDFSSIVVLFLGSWSCWFLSKNMIKNSKTPDQMMSFIAFTISSGLFIYGLINLILFIKTNGLINEGRLSYDFWSNSVIAATGNGLLFTNITSLAVGWLFFEKKRKKRIISYFIIIVSSFSSYLYQNRTLLLIILILLLIGFIIKLYEKKTYNSVRNFIVGIFSIFTLKIIIDRIGLFSFLKESTIFKRFENFNNDRLKLIIDFLKQNPFQYYLGGKNIKLNVGYVHNTWLDMLNDVGIMPFALFVIYTIIVVKYIIVSLRDGLSTNIKCVSFLLIGQMINFFVEPIMSANTMMFLSFIIISSAYINAIEQVRKENK